MTGYLRRLATTGAAYTASSVISKLIAVALLPLYTRYLTPADYGAAEVLITGVIAASIVIRLGIIEALLRFYYQAGEEPAQVVKTAFASLLWTTTIGLLVALPLAEPISRLLLDHSDPALMRIAIFGLWVFTMFEFLTTLYRIDERAKAYFAFTVANVLITIPVTVWLVVGQDKGASGLLWGQYGTGAVFLAGLVISQRHRLAVIPDFAIWRRMLRWGLPTMPAELSLYSLNFIDRVLIVRLVGLGDAGLYSLSVKFAQAVNVLVKGFQLAWPPLAYSITDDDEARRAYAVIVTWFVSVTTFVVAGMWLLSRWIVRALAAPEFFDSYKTIGLVSTGVMLYALYLVLVIILGRTGRTEFNFPATGAGTVVNIGLNLVLLPSMGIVGAGVSLVASYAVVLVLMYVFTQRLFRVPYEWLRLGQATGLAAALVLAGELLFPTSGLGGLAGRTALWLAYPLVLWATGFLNEEERQAVGRLLDPATAMARFRALRDQPPPEPPEEPGEERPEAEGEKEPEEARGRWPRLTRETLEAEQRDEDAIR
jgi:O-antigen/teichoic acid export membrane protein